MSKYFELFKNRMQINLVYRFDLIGYLIIELIAVASVGFLWLSVYKGEGEIGGFSLDQAILYYFFLPLIGSVTMVELSKSLGWHIKDGFLSHMLLQPMKVWGVYVANDLGRKSYPLMVTTLVYLLISFVVVTVFGLDFDFSFLMLGVALVSAGFGLILNYVMDVALAYLAFWVDDIWGFEHFKYVAFSILGGLSFPFEFVPENIRFLFELSPFKYMYYVPVSYLTGKRDLSKIPGDIIIWAFWMVMTSIVAFLLWKKGIKKYAAYGN